MKNLEKYDLVVGIPCSKLKDLTDRIEDYIPCTSESESMGIAAGAYLMGKKPLVFLQNSGLGNCVDIITSLLKPYDIDIPMVISVRNRPEQHSFMGKITWGLLKLLEYDQNVELVIQK